MPVLSAYNPGGRVLGVALDGDASLQVDLGAMTMTGDRYQSVPAGSSPILLARFTTNSGAVAVKASVSGITCKVYDLDGDVTTASSTISASAASNVFDTLQTDGLWTEDATGYNFSLVVPAASIPLAPRRYRVEVKADMASGADLWIGRWILETSKTYS